MTGRDYKELVKLHRDNSLKHDESLKYFSKLADKNIVKFKKVNYEVLQKFIDERKEAAKNSLQKVQNLEEIKNQKKEELLLKQHLVVWIKELSRLENLERKAEEDIEACVKQIDSYDYLDLSIEDNEDDFELYTKETHFDEVEEYKTFLSRQMPSFLRATLEPVKNLIEDLKYYLSSTSNKAIIENTKQNDEIFETINAVKRQQNNLITTLSDDALELWLEIDEYNSQFKHNDFNNIIEGIPVEALDLEAPDEELKQSVLNEFLIIDFKYREKLNTLEETHSKALSENKSKFDCLQNEVFNHIYEHYHFHNPNLTNCPFTLRDLIFDRIKRYFKLFFNQNVNREQLVEHEKLLDIKKYYNQQHKLILTEWPESKKALLEKAEATFQEAFEMIEIQRIKNEEKEKQLRVCQELYEKVKEFREKKLEALEIQQKLDKMLEAERADKLRLENEREEQKRLQQKRNIQDYHERVSNQKQIEVEKTRKRLESLKNQLKEQAFHDQERIQFRKNLHEQRLNEHKIKKVEQQKEKEEKERRIQKLVEKVKPNVEADPARLVSFTEAELARRGIVNSDDAKDKYKDKKELFEIKTFTEKQLNADARLRIEARLRQAGLINSDYARAIVSNINPPRQPRRDMSTNLNWNGFALDKNL